MPNNIDLIEELLESGGVLPLDVAARFMCSGFDMNSIDDYGFDAEFEITPQLLEKL